MFEFQEGIPLPPRKGPKSTVKYPFATMPVGASFFVPKISSASLFGAAARYSVDGVKFSVRTATENGVKGARAWRIA